MGDGRQGRRFLRNRLLRNRLLQRGRFHFRWSIREHRRRSSSRRIRCRRFHGHETIPCLRTRLSRGDRRPCHDWRHEAHSPSRDGQRRRGQIRSLSFRSCRRSDCARNFGTGCRRSSALRYRRGLLRCCSRLRNDRLDGCCRGLRSCRDGLQRSGKAHCARNHHNRCRCLCFHACPDCGCGRTGRGRGRGPCRESESVGAMTWAVGGAGVGLCVWCDGRE